MSETKQSTENIGIIYMISGPNGKKYIGQNKTANAERRMEQHRIHYQRYMKLVNEERKKRS